MAPGTARRHGREACPAGPATARAAVLLTVRRPEGRWDGPNFQINGHHVNFGPVLLQIRSNSGTVLWSQTVTATDYPGFPGGALYAQAPIGDCSSDPSTTDNDYVIAYDTVSGRWSNELPIDSDCASF